MRKTSKVGLLATALAIGAMLTLTVCTQRTDRQVAERYCGGCHLFPEAELLPQDTWLTGVLPAMANYLGLSRQEYDELSMLEQAYLDHVRYYPSEPLIDTTTWARILRYYQEEAPASLPSPAALPPAAPLDEKFRTRYVRNLSGAPDVTMLRYVPERQRLLVGLQDGQVLSLDSSARVRERLQFSSTVSDVSYHDGALTIAEMGEMSPSDLYAGRIWRQPFPATDGGAAAPTLLLEQVNRPVDLEYADLQGDQHAELLICEFGHRIGSLFWIPANAPEVANPRHVLSEQPGARVAIATDLNGDERTDVLALLTQGDERVVWYDPLTSSAQTLLQFLPVYGSSYLEWADMNGDGFGDLVYTNGDNGDYSRIFKPYHGLRIYLNNGRMRFEQAWWQPMNGASQTITRDFDGDGDLDIAAISYFPKLDELPEEGFYYFENLGDMQFRRYSSPSAAAGRWLVMESGDIDGDGDEDLILGSCVTTLRNDVPEAFLREWLRENISLLILENRQR